MLVLASMQKDTITMALGLREQQRGAVSGTSSQPEVSKAALKGGGSSSVSWSH